MIQIAVINASTVATNAEVQCVIAAAQKSLDRDFGPAMGIYASMSFYTHADAVAGKILPGSWWLVVVNTSDQAGALGYHQRTSSGRPMAKVAWGTTLDAGMSPSGTFDHELKEMLGDPEINLVVPVVLGRHGYAVAYELSDPCEADKFGYVVDNVLLSDWCLPLYFVFDAPVPPGAKLDFCGHIKKPGDILEDGYIGKLSFETGEWSQEEPNAMPTAALAARRVTRHGAKIHSRHERRTLDRKLWRNSAPVAA